MTTLLDRTRIVSIDVDAPGVGTVTRWYVKNGESVARAQQLGIFVNGTSILPLQAPAAGRVNVLVREGVPVDAGAQLATIAPLPAPSPEERQAGRTAPPIPSHTPAAPRTGNHAPGRVHSPTAPPSAPTPKHTPAPSHASQRAPSSPSKPDIAPAANGNGRAAPYVEELILTPQEQPKAPQVSRSAPPKPVVMRHTVHLSSQQIDELRALAYRLKVEQGAGAFSQSEIARAAIQLFLDLPEPARLAVLEKNRAREAAGQWGAGYPRPEV